MTHDASEVIINIPKVHNLLLESENFETVLIEYINSIILVSDDFGQTINDVCQNSIRLNRFSELTECLVYNQDYEDMDDTGYSEEMESMELDISNCNDNLFPISGIIDEFFDSNSGRNLINEIVDSEWVLENILPHSADSIMLIFGT